MTVLRRIAASKFPNSFQVPYCPRKTHATITNRIEWKTQALSRESKQHRIRALRVRFKHDFDHINTQNICNVF